MTKHSKCGHTDSTEKERETCMKNVFTKRGEKGVYMHEYRELINDIKKIFSQGNSSQKTHMNIFIKEIERWLGNQCLVDPYIYISHGPNHSLEVVKYIQMLYDNDTQVQKSLMTNYKLQYSSKTDDLNVLFTRIVVRLLALLHDVGYTDVAHNLGSGKNAVKKWIHGKSGEKIVRKNITLFFSNAIDIINGVKHGVKKAKLTKDFLNAIKYHNADSEKKKFTIDKKNFTACWKPHDKELTAKKSRISREYVSASIKKSPLIYLIRTSDNLDFSRSRMIPEHKDAKLIQMVLDLYKINKPIGRHDDIISKWWRGLSDKNRGMKTFYNELHVPSYGTTQFPHFYGVWIVKKSVFSRINKCQPALYNLHVTYYDEKDELVVEKNRWAALYQLIRFNEALKSVKGGGSNITKRINVSLFKENGTQIDNTFLLNNIDMLYGDKNNKPVQYNMELVSGKKKRTRKKRTRKKTRK
jgi:hypothetical protein